jgi:hypothetical protein
MLCVGHLRAVVVQTIADLIGVRQPRAAAGAAPLRPIDGLRQKLLPLIGKINAIHICDQFNEALGDLHDGRV